MMTTTMCTTGKSASGGHCCWIEGKVCPHLETGTVEGRVYACGLLRVHGSWDKVYETPEYKATDAAHFFTNRYPGFGCGDWPQNIPQAMASPVGKCCYQGVSS